MGGDSARSRAWKRMVVAFFFHAPGLRFLLGIELAPDWKRMNRGALALTCVLSGGSAYAELWGSPARSFFSVWLVGHFAWSFILASALK